MAEGKSNFTPRMEQFCREYIIDLNATQAAIRAGYSKSTARAIGCENLTKPDIQERLAQLSEERNQRNKIDADYVLQQAKKIHEMAMDSIDLKNAISSLKLVGEHIAVGAFKQMQQQVNVTVNNRTLDDFYQTMEDD